MTRLLEPFPAGGRGDAGRVSVAPERSPRALLRARWKDRDPAGQDPRFPTGAWTPFDWATVLPAGAFLLALLAAPSCGGESPAAGVHPVAGVVVSIDAAGGQAVIAHEEIPGLMPAMTMPFRFESADELAALRAGDRIEADYVTVPGIGPCLRGVRVTAPASP